MNIVQFGCNDAVDQLFDYVKDNRHIINHVHLVDANPFALELAKKRYESILDSSKFTVYHFALVCDRTEEVDLYFPIEEKWSGHSSIFKELTALNWNNLDSIKVSTKNPDVFLRTIDRIDQLHIDVEGLDSDIILYLIPFLSSNRIPYIVFESAHSDGYFSRGTKYNTCIERLTSLGYTLYNKDLDTICILQ